MLRCKTACFGDRPPMSDSLPALTAEVHRQLALLSYPREEWVPSRGEDVLDVAIIGGGQAGLATAFGLRRQMVGRVAILDRAAPGGAGCWTSFARMRTLRTPKHVSGPDLGVPALTPEAFFRARDGDAAWEALAKIGRVDWQAYLDWVQATLALPVRYGHDVTGIDHDPATDLLLLRVMTAEGPVTLRARKAVLATGMDGMGAWSIPAPFDALPADRVSHTSGPVDFAALAGKRVIVIGAGASAFDNLATALEEGAAAGIMLVRRPTMPRVNPFRWMEQAGFLGQFHAMPDALKWRFTRHIFDLNQPPPQASWDRVAHDPRFSLFMGAPSLGARMEGEEVVIDTPQGPHRADHVIVGTGTSFDMGLRPELAGLAPHILLWRDVYTPPKGLEWPALGACPYLEPTFALREKTPGTAPGLRHIHLINYGATPSMGLSGASISGLKFGVARLVDGICRMLWLEDAGQHLDSLLGYDEWELTSPIPQEVRSAAE
ncbi:cation diffusion facilitator CzcD-associated flavoprotein CzcO [Humitalea rosea]|uniref:Cation diffusion facilitator CzcD-associated flavoprotein CzcO n=1 Tax=Humitalea rosea TaxID=990373 RepID=A0A2W7IJ66_9PROT|nr:NAD(P)/FAD-dependent oxidoreductase [Humitalea rosea]PZW46738.1 cation diffusion facilitator CzcD-associated flavoprotein CzcO [Humitalea rosea]